MARVLALVAAAGFLLAGCASAPTPPPRSPATTATATATAAATATPTTTPTTNARRGRVTIAPDVYAVNGLGNSNESILVRGSFGTAAGLAAVRRVAARLFLVDETGVEHADDSNFPPVDALGNDLYTPNYVADPEVRPDGIRLYVDCKAVIEEPMRRTFLRILREELAVLGDVTVVNAG